MVAPGAQNSRMSSSRLPRTQPTAMGTMLPTRTMKGISAAPLTPMATMVRNGPSLMERMETAPTSLESPNSPARAE